MDGLTDTHTAVLTCTLKHAQKAKQSRYPGRGHDGQLENL